MAIHGFIIGHEVSNRHELSYKLIKKIWRCRGRCCPKRVVVVALKVCAWPKRLSNRPIGLGCVCVYVCVYVMCLCLCDDSFLCACVMCLFLCLCFLKFTIPGNSPYHVFGNRTRDLPSCRTMLYHLSYDTKLRTMVLYFGVGLCRCRN